MSLSDDVQAVLSADPVLIGLLTGGIYTRKEMGRLAVFRDSALPIFDADQVLQPIAIVNLRDELPTGEIQDTETQEQSVIQVVEVWFYDDGDHGFDTIAMARRRAYGLLFGQHVGKYILLKSAPDVQEKYDRLLSNAAYERSDFSAYTVKNNNYYDY